jgi:hypothetical protein
MGDDALTEAGGLIDAGDAMGAVRRLRAALGYPGNALREGFDGARALGLLATAFGAVGEAALGATVAAVAADFDDPQGLYDAAYALYEAGLHDVAATLLDRANALLPGQVSLLSELVANLEALMRYGDARRVLEGSGLDGSNPLVTYLTGFAAMMCGDVAAARARVDRLHDAEGDVVVMREQLRGMTMRAEALVAAGVGLGPRALTAWQAAIDGTVLLHESPYGYEQGMAGRYAYLGDSPALMRTGIERLRGWLDATGRRPLRVVAAPDPASRALALAVARTLAVPSEVWSPGAASSALVVAWDLAAGGDAAFVRALHAHAPGQLLYAHASDWVEPFEYAPDVTAVLYQSITHPFTGGALRVDPQTGKVGPTAPDARGDEALAAEILGAVAEDESAAPLDVAVAVARALEGIDAEHALGADRTSGTRHRQRAGSPVSSSYFT